MKMKSPSCLRIIFQLFYSLVIIIFLTTSIVSSDSSHGNNTDHEALLSFKNMIPHDPYGALSSWNNSFHFCDWNGVSCGKRHRRVTHIHLQSQGLVGTLSPQVGNLSFLLKLELYNNSFHGSIPHELGRLSRLRVILLHNNTFDGVIPSNLSRCSNLEKLSIGFNKLVGSIPNEISYLSKLALLSFHYNSLTGGIPPFIGNISSMEVFSGTGNPLGGSIPNTLGHLKSMRHLYCGGCNLSGIIHPSIYNLSLLESFSLTGNHLSGRLPSAIGGMLPHLSRLQLGQNQLSGSIPTSISNCSELTFLGLYSNNFSGKLAIDFANLRNIYYIAVYENNLYGGLKFIDSMNNCSNLVILDLSFCSFQGTLPKTIGNLSDKLWFLNFQRNKLHGELPSSIGNLVGLTVLPLSYNQLTGNLPATIGRLQKLQILDMSHNQFSGLIPGAIGNLSMMDKLLLYSNRLEGRIPSSMGNCYSLNLLSLYDNKLNGKIPKQIFQLPSLSIELDLSNNNFIGSLPNEIGGLNKLSTLTLDNNYLSGTIPSSLGGCTSLVSLSLNGNLFQGKIPLSLSSLRGIAALDLSDNNLSGQIPQFLEKLSLEYLNLSYNDFEGEVPVQGVFANASVFSILGNNGLCGGLVELKLPKCKETKRHKEKKFPLFVIGVLIASTIAIALCFFYFKKKSKGRSSQLSRNAQFMQVSYNQLLRATDGFSEANLIGKGGFSSVYKGILEGDDRFVAIKVVHLQNLGAQRSFIRECEAWRHIRHRNLLKIIAVCSSTDFQGNDFKALVYEFMPNGGIDDWLHSSAHTSRLSLLQRINILIDVASALDYFHNRCLVTLVHGDLKSTNILLDEDMVAHVGDYGLSRFLGTNSNQNGPTGVIGTIGYAPPEYGLDNVRTSSGDVYSFGILLLEVMTGKRPTNDIFNESLNLHKYAFVALPDHVLDIIDVHILNYQHENAIITQSMEARAKELEECLASIVKIGVLCSVYSPPQRMNIENVINELQHIRDSIQSI